MRTPTGLVAVLIGAVLVASCSSPSSSTSTTSGPATHEHVIGLPTFALPPATQGCTGAVPAGDGGISVPMTVSRVGTQVAEMVNVCVAGQGPFPFVVDTGASSTVFDTALAKQLGLAVAGNALEFAGVGCVGKAHPYGVTTWSLSGLPLAPQNVTAATIPGIGGPGEPVGLLGADVWSRFAAVRFDFARGVLVVPSQEGPAPTTVEKIDGPTTVPTPPSLIGTAASFTAPLMVLEAPGVVEASTPVDVGGHHGLPFGVDTGSSQSVVDDSKAHELASADTLERQTTVCSTITVPLVHSGPWTVAKVPTGTIPLKKLVLAETNLGLAAGGSDGLLGSDQLANFSWVVLDYRGGRLVFGPP
ncbi:MAG TPA: aspartyl protease family protein [Acidimicrobiales bacterium]|nr:aspartyl protease family protein [Acidimicrobiales bacterium]